MPNAQGTPSTDAYLGSVSCVTSTFCLAVGSNNRSRSRSISLSSGTVRRGPRSPCPRCPVRSIRSSTRSPASPPASVSRSGLDDVSSTQHAADPAVDRQRVRRGAGRQRAELRDHSRRGVVPQRSPFATPPARPGPTRTRPSSSSGTERPGAPRRSPPATGVTEVQVLGMSCGTTSSCMVVGQALVGTTTSNYSVQLTGGTWYGANTPTPSGVNASMLESVSCVGTAFCTAVGDIEPDQRARPSRISSRRGTARRGRSSRSLPSTPPTYANFFSGVSCFSATSCTAVGATWTSVLGADHLDAGAELERPDLDVANSLERARCLPDGVRTGSTA